MPVPVSAHAALFQEIIQTLNKQICSKDRNSLARQRVLKNLEPKASALLEMNRPYGLSALGAIACAKGDIQAMHRNHRESIVIGGKDETLYFNYANSLEICGFPKEAYAYAKVAYDEMGDRQEDLLGVLINVCGQLGWDAEIELYAAAWERLTKKPHKTYLRHQEEIEEAKQITRLCMEGALSGLSSILNDPEEDEAWAHLTKEK